MAETGQEIILHRRAFTLIELLVVIAIIAILAAILFPVFAQAKAAAKKTQTLSNIKQSATAILIYVGDADDNFPSAYSVEAGNGQCNGITPGAALTSGGVAWFTGLPAGSDAAIYEPCDGQAWWNSTQPYMKNWQLLQASGATTTEVYAVTPALKPLQAANFTMNGLISTMSATAVNAPSRVPLLWEGAYNHNQKNAILPNPVLNCAANEVPCRFNPGAGTSADRGDGIYNAIFPSDSVWVHGKGMVFVGTDSSARFVQINPGGARISPAKNHPFFEFTAAGQAVGAMVRCSTGGRRYSSFFRPDLDNDNWPLNVGGAAPSTQSCTQ